MVVTYGAAGRVTSDAGIGTPALGGKKGTWGKPWGSPHREPTGTELVIANSTDCDLLPRYL